MMEECAMELKEKNEKYWDESSEIYSDLILEELSNFKKDAWKNLIKRNVEKDNYKKVLDVGTGPGFFAIIMSQMGYEVTAVDSSEMMIKQAMNNAKVVGVNANFIQCDVDSLPFQEDSFDIIISRNVTWTLQEPEKVYKLWHKILKKEGKVIIFDANWNERLINPEIQKRYEKDIEEAKKLGFYIDIGDSLEAEGDSISLKLPLTYEKRPAWDKEILSKIGFKEIIIDDDINKEVHVAAERIANRTTPMFYICAKK